MKIKSPISELVEMIILVILGLATGVLVFDSVALGVWLGMMSICVKILVSYATMAVDLLILIAKRLDIIIERGGIK